jgi:four helix bundle protein
MPFLFEKLDVYRRALDLADDLARRAAGFPRGHRALADQLTRAAISIAANIAEGNGRFAPGNRGQFFAIPRGRRASASRTRTRGVGEAMEASERPL